MRDSLFVPLETFVAGNTTPAGTAMCALQLCAVTTKHVKSIAGQLSQSVICYSLSFSASVRDSSISTMLSEELPSASCRRWLYEDIKEARFMRFLLEVRHPNCPADA